MEKKVTTTYSVGQESYGGIGMSTYKREFTDGENKLRAHLMENLSGLEDSDEFLWNFSRSKLHVGEKL